MPFLVMWAKFSLNVVWNNSWTFEEGIVRKSARVRRDPLVIKIELAVKCGSDFPPVSGKGMVFCQDMTDSCLDT